MSDGMRADAAAGMSDSTRADAAAGMRVIVVDDDAIVVRSLATILGAEPDRIVYVSCNPASQARDLAILGRKYTITAVQPVDMFPHTQHVENVCALKLKNESFN